MTTGGEAGGGRMVRRYGPEVVALHWAWSVTFQVMLLFGLLLLRDWAVREFGVIGAVELLPTPSFARAAHGYLGLAVVVIGLVHLLVHSRQRDRPILPRDLRRGIAASYHNVLYVLFLSSRDERGATGKYKENQKMTYVATFYCVALSAITGLLVWLTTRADLWMLLHVIAGVLILFLSAYRILHLIRKHDRVALRSILVSGKVPEWYVRKRHPLWHRELGGGYRRPPELDLEALEGAAGAAGGGEGERA